MVLKLFRFAVMASLLSSCAAVGPDFKRPGIALGPIYAFAPRTAIDSAARQRWWEGLSDPELNRLVERGLARNYSVKAAVERIREAEALVRTTGINSAVSGDITGRAQRTQANGTFRDSKSASFAPIFLIDLFGGQRRAREQALAQRDQSVFDEAAARLALQRAIVQRYLELRYWQAIKRQRQSSIANKRRVATILRDRYAVREETRYALRRAEAQVDLERGRIPEADEGIQTSAIAIAALLAETDGELIKRLTASAGPQPRPGHRVNPGVPAALLQNRPDVRAAEAAFAAAVAAVGVSEAQLYPSLRIGGTVTVSTIDSVTIGPTLTVPVLDRALRMARRDAAASRARQADLAWRSSVITAVSEVQTSLAQLATFDQQSQAFERASRKFREATRLSRSAFELGAITLVEVLDAEEKFNETELRVAGARLSFAQAWSDLNVSIGQGWLAGKDGESAEPATLASATE